MAASAPITPPETSTDDLCVTCGRTPGVPRPVPLRTVHCGPCWATFGGSPDAEDIAAPPLEALGSRDPVDQREWPALLASEAWVQQLRRDCRAKLLATVRELTLTASWSTWESWPGWDRLMDVSGWARSTLAGWLRQLRLLGWLSVIESGSTPQFRPMSLAHVEGNRRAVYALRVPRRPGEHAAQDVHQDAGVAAPQAESVMPGSELEKRTQAAWRAFAAGPGHPSDQGKPRAGEETWTPTWFFDLSSWVSSWVSSRARAVFHSSQVNALSDPKIEGLRPRIDQGYRGFSARVPATGPQMLAAAAELRHQHPVLARLTIRAVRALCRPYWRAGWTNADVLHALEYRPTSWNTLPAMDPAKVLAPYRWCQSRLSAWRTDTGRVLPGHTQCQQERRRREAAVIARHGRAALAALPVGSDRLCPADVRRHGQRQHAAAVEQLRRQRARELSDQRAAVRPAAEAASAEHALRMASRVRAELERRRADRAELRERLLARAHAAVAHQTSTDDPAASTWTPPEPAETPADGYERARARARAEGRLPLRRRRPRR